MVDIPENLLENLKCVQCDGYLSTTPIIITQDGQNICGNCISEEHENISEIGTRNTAYEDLATLVLFPCRYKNDGCTFKQALNKIKFHELGCEHRIEECPLSAIDECNWTGKHQKLQQHFIDNHAELVVTHPYEIQVDISKNYEKYFLIEVFKLLFLLQVKCNIAAAKLWYCVRFLGNPKYAKLFQFEVDIGCQNESIRKKKFVQTNETLLLSQNKIIEFDINALLTTVNSSDKDKIISKISIYLCNVKCLLCSKEYKENAVYLKSKGFFCYECHKLTKCKYNSNGCKFEDFQINLSKHETLFCKLSQQQCNFKNCLYKCCNNNLINHLLNTHFMHTKQYHSLTTAKLEYNTWYAEVLLLENIKFITDFKFSNSKLYFRILSTLKKNEIIDYKCTLKIINSKTNYFVEKELLIDLISSEFDWWVDIDDDVDKTLLYACFVEGVPKYFYDKQLVIVKK